VQFIQNATIGFKGKEQTANPESESLGVFGAGKSGALLVIEGATEPTYGRGVWAVTAK
jgi:hypothetical protein